VNISSAQPTDIVDATVDLLGDVPDEPAAVQPADNFSAPPSPTPTCPSASSSSMDIGEHLDAVGSSQTPSMDIAPLDGMPTWWGLGSSATAAAASAAEDSFDESLYASPPSLSCWAAAWPVTRRPSRRRRRGKRGGGFSGGASPAGSWSPAPEADTLVRSERLGVRVRAAAAAAVAAGVAVPAAFGSPSATASVPVDAAMAVEPPAARVTWAESSDVTATHVAAGRDMQGIPWETMLCSRESYREQRLAEQRATYASARESGGGGDAPSATMATATAAAASTTASPGTASPLFSTPGTYGTAATAAGGVRPLRALRFVYGTRSLRCSINHFQLRNLVWAPSPHDVYLLQDNGVVHWDAVTRSRRCVLDLSGATPGLPHVQVSTMTAGAGLLLAGGFDGEFVAADAAAGRLVHQGRLSASAAAITTGLEVYEQDVVHGPSVITCSNDTVVRTFDAASLGAPTRQEPGGGSVGGAVATHHLPWAVNHVSRQPRGGRLLAVAGDNAAVVLLDAAGGRTTAAGTGGRSAPSAVMATLGGHTDHCFATAWSPDGVLLATGSQDGSARLWDVRRPGSALGVCGGPADGPVRSLRFSPNGRLLAVAEPRDFVRAIDVASVAAGGGRRPVAAQDVDVFGEVGGVAFTPDGRGLFIGVHDDNYGCLLEMEVRSGRRADTDAVGL